MEGDQSDVLTECMNKRDQEQLLALVSIQWFLIECLPMLTYIRVADLAECSHAPELVS